MYIYIYIYNNISLIISQSNAIHDMVYMNVTPSSIIIPRLSVSSRALVGEWVRGRVGGWVRVECAFQATSCAQSGGGGDPSCPQDTFAATKSPPSTPCGGEA